MNLALALRLGRISNLPTVWTNVLVGFVLAGGRLADPQLPALDAESLAALRRFDDPVYLHQVVQRRADGIVRFADLPAALASLDGSTADREWRVHFHVPIFLGTLAPFASTQSFIRDVLAIHRESPVSSHLEVETYTWDVLPEPFRSGSVDEAVARELAWVRAELRA